MSELQRRFLVAAVGIPVAFLVVLLGGAALAAMLGILAALGAREFYALVRTEPTAPMEAAGTVLAAAMPLAVHGNRLGVLSLGPTAAMIALLALTGAAIWTRGPSGHPAAAIAVTLFGAVYAGGTLSFAYLLRYHDYTVTAAAGTAILFFPLVVTWICDSAAYAVGRKWGRHKLIPRVSPGKTVEGAIAGTVAGGICALLYVLLVLRPTSQMTIAPAWAVLLGIVIAVVAQVGDLAESLFKRAAGVKDSSSLLPGHGGILDRLDSLYFVLPLSFLLIGSLLIPAPR